MPSACKVQENLFKSIIIDITLSVNESLKNYLKKTEKSLDIVVREYLEWVNHDRLLIFEQTRFHSATRYFASLMPKRGNKKYASRLKQRFKELSLPFDYEKKISKNVSETLTNVLFLYSHLRHRHVWL